jgi:hypothetical protein
MSDQSIEKMIVQILIRQPMQQSISIEHVYKKTGQESRAFGGRFQNGHRRNAQRGRPYAHIYKIRHESVQFVRRNVQSRRQCVIDDDTAFRTRDHILVVEK